MAKFQIQYAERTPQVQATAAPQQVSPEYGAMAQAGQAIFQIGSQLQQQKNAVDFSEGQRIIDEQINAAVDSLTGDEKSDLEIWDKLQQDIGQVQYGNNRVNSSLEIYRNKILPNAQQAISKRHKTLVRQNNRDQFEAQGQTYLAKGDVVAYQDILDRRLATKDISQAEYESLSKSALSDSLLEQARDLISSDSGAKRNRGLGILNNLTDVEGIELSTQQKEYRNRLLKVARTASKEKSDQTIGEIVVQKDNLKNASVLEKQQAADQMKQALINGGVTGDKLQQWFDNLDEWSGGDKDPTELYDPQTYAGLQATVDLNPTSLTEGQIYSFVGQGKNGGITIGQARSLAELRKRNVDEVGKVQNEVHRRYQDILKGMHRADLFGEGPEGATQYAELANRLTVFANTNKDATTTDYEQFFAGLTAESEKKSWFRVAASWLPPFSYFKSLGVSKTGREELAGVDAGIKRITGVHERILTEAWERRQQRQVGREVTVGGERWRLTKKAEFATDDVWERVE